MRHNEVAIKMLVSRESKLGMLEPLVEVAGSAVVALVEGAVAKADLFWFTAASVKFT